MLKNKFDLVTVLYLGNGTSLSNKRIIWIKNGLIGSMPNHQIELYFKNKAHILATSDHIAIAFEKNMCVGLIALSNIEHSSQRIIYIETILIAEHLQSTILFLKIVACVFQGLLLMEKSLPDLIAMKTYNPKAYMLMKYFIGDNDSLFYPLINRRNKKYNQKMAKLIASKLSPNCLFNPLNGVVYEGGSGISSQFWNIKPRSCSNSVNNFFNKNLENQDRLLCFVNLNSYSSKSQVLKFLRITG